MEHGINNLWPTPVLYEQVEDKDLLDRFTQELLLTTDLAAPPSDFQKYDVLRDGSEVVQEFKQKVIIPAFEKYLQEINGKTLADYGDYRLRSWITGTGYGYTIPVHNHSGSALSAVFYILCEEQDKGGQLHMLDPRPNANRGYDESFKHLFKPKVLTPKTGDVIIFPSFMYHNTLPFMGKLRLAMPVDFFPGDSVDTWNLY